MIKGKSIASYLLLLLLLIFSNGQAYHSPAFPLIPSSGKTTISRSQSVRPCVFIKTHSVKKDRIRVRYMAGECPYNCTSIPIDLRAPDFIDRIKGANYISFIFSTPHFLFKLRGPPPIA